MRISEVCQPVPSTPLAQVTASTPDADHPTTLSALEEARQQIKDRLSAGQTTPNLVSLKPELNPFTTTIRTNGGGDDEPTTVTFRTTGQLEEVRQQIRDSLTTQRIQAIDQGLFNPFAPTTTPRPEDTTPEPMATMRNAIRDMLATSTEAPPVNPFQALSSTPPPPTEDTEPETTTTTQSAMDRMVAARDRLRAMMGKPPLGHRDGGRSGDRLQQLILRNRHSRTIIMCQFVS